MPKAETTNLINVLTLYFSSIHTHFDHRWIDTLLHVFCALKRTLNQNTKRDFFNKNVVASNQQPAKQMRLFPLPTLPFVLSVILFLLTIMNNQVNSLKHDNGSFLSFGGSSSENTGGGISYSSRTGGAANEISDYKYGSIVKEISMPLTSGGKLPTSKSHSSFGDGPNLGERRSSSFVSFRGGSTAYKPHAAGASVGNGSNHSFGSSPGGVLRRNSSFASYRGGATSTKPASLDVVDGAGPPFGAWIIPALTCAVSYALYNISIKKASNDIDPVLGGVLLQVVAAMMGMIIFFGKSYGNTEGHLVNQSGIIWSIAAGISVGMAEILSFVVSGKGVPATQSIPIIIGGSVLFGTMMGQFFLKEAVSYKGWGGILLISTGIVLIGMEGDPSPGH